MNKDDKNRHFMLLIIDISKHGAKEMGHVKMAGPGFMNDVTAWWPGFVPKQFTNKQEPLVIYPGRLLLNGLPEILVFTDSQIDKRKG